MTRSAIETHSGVLFRYERPTSYQIILEDIAHGLSQICRFGGHTRVFYSVGEHALLVRHLVRELGHPQLSFVALHHDSHEAYIGDIPTPLKRYLGDKYYTTVRATDKAIGEALGIHLDQFLLPEIVKADQLAMQIEVKELKRNVGNQDEWGFDPDAAPSPPWPLGKPPGLIKSQFLEAHSEDLVMGQRLNQ